MSDESVNVLPANQSIVVADSQFKSSFESHYAFTAKLGSGIYAKELYYSQLYWTQPLFAHNNGNNELIFSMQDDDSTLYVVYATPFIMYNQYDGNPPGTSLLPPQPFSYCWDMELAFNGDVRLLANNAVPINGNGIININGSDITFQFRYCPSKGFCLYPVQDNVLGTIYTVKFWPCSYIANAHFTHGFGIINPAISTISYSPRSYYAPCIWSDTVPHLMPYRYVVVTSNELTKDRRLMSFSNGAGSQVVTSELAVFATDPDKTRIYSLFTQGEDASVVGLRSNYTPQSFDIAIHSELGKILRCGDPVSKALQDPSVNTSAQASFWSPALRNRGNSTFTNYLLFGYNWQSGVLFGGNTFSRYHMAMEPAANHGFYNVTWDGLVASLATHLFESPGGAIPRTKQFPIGLQGPTPSLIQPYAVSTQPCGIDNAYNNLFPNTPGSLSSVGAYYTWNPSLNSTPILAFEMSCTFTCSVANPSFHQYFYIFMYDLIDGSPFNWNSPTSTPIMYFIVLDLFGVTYPFSSVISAGNFISGSKNPSFNPNDYPNPNAIPIMFSMVGLWSKSSSPGDYFRVEVTGPPYSGDDPYFQVMGPNQVVGNYYNPPQIQAGYPFGDPLADAKCEPLIHEIVAVLEHN